MTAGTISRRTLLAGAGAGAIVAVTPFTRADTAEVAGSDLFTLGVASGDPQPDGVVLWTRLAPEPLAGGGMPVRPVDVQWEVATDERFRRIVRRGVTRARPELAHSVHVELDGLEPATWYWYRFRSGASISRVGRTRTAPAPRSSPERLRFAFVSCQSYTAGFYTAYRHMAEEDLDLVVHLGDYIYEAAPSGKTLRRHEGDGEPSTLIDYRNRHAQYKTDPHLQAAHAAFPFTVTWDDHEIDNNWADALPQDPDEQSLQAFLERRVNALQGYYESMPLRRSSIPRQANLQLYRHVTYGDLAAFHVLDGRQYRTDQPCEQPNEFRGEPDCADRYDANATMLGRRQERWLHDSLRASPARWNVLANQTILAQYDYDPSGGRNFNTDQWDGYPAMRRRLLELMGSGEVNNPVVITGDWHSSWVNELKVDFDDPDAATVGTEFAGTSISSNCGWVDDVAAALDVNPHVRFFDGDRRGYVRCELTSDQFQADFRLLPPSDVDGVTVASPNLDLDETVTWIVPDGGTVQPG